MKNKKLFFIANFFSTFLFVFFLGIVIFPYHANATCSGSKGETCTNSFGMTGKCELGPDGIQLFCSIPDGAVGNSCETTDKSLPGRYKKSGSSITCVADNPASAEPCKGNIEGGNCTNSFGMAGKCVYVSGQLSCSVPEGSGGNSCTDSDGNPGVYKKVGTQYECDTAFVGPSAPGNSSTSPTGNTTLPKCDTGFEEVAGVCIPTATGLPDPSGGVLEILSSFLSWLFGLFTILAIGAFVISGIQYLASAGDTGIIEIAKRNMKWSLVGVIVGLSGFLILRAVVAALGGNAIF